MCVSSHTPLHGCMYVLLSTMVSAPHFVSKSACQAKRMVNQPRVNLERSPAELKILLGLRDAEVMLLRSKLVDAESAVATLREAAAQTLTSSEQQ